MKNKSQDDSLDDDNSCLMRVISLSSNLFLGIRLYHILLYCILNSLAEIDLGSFVSLLLNKLKILCGEISFEFFVIRFEKN